MPRDEHGGTANAGTGNQPRWLNDKNLAAHLDVGVMTLYRWQNDQTLGFPLASRINGTKRTSLDEVEAWLRERRSRPNSA